MAPAFFLDEFPYYLGHPVDDSTIWTGILIVRDWSASAGYGLPDPPCGIRAEFVATPVFEFFDCRIRPMFPS